MLRSQGAFCGIFTVPAAVSRGTQQNMMDGAILASAAQFIKQVHLLVPNFAGLLRCYWSIKSFLRSHYSFFKYCHYLCFYSSYTSLKPIPHRPGDVIPLFPAHKALKVQNIVMGSCKSVILYRHHLANVRVRFMTLGLTLLLSNTVPISLRSPTQFSKFIL